MEKGTDFLKSRLARRFCLLFLSCAFLPTVALIVLSYYQVVGQLESQSLLRLKRELKTYGVSLFDRMIRIENEMKNIGRLAILADGQPVILPEEYSWDLQEIFSGIVIYRPPANSQALYGSFEDDSFRELISPELMQNPKPFAVTSASDNGMARFYFGTTISPSGSSPFVVVAEVRRQYLWGIGANHLLPPMTELSVFNGDGDGIVYSENGPRGDYEDFEFIPANGDLRIFRFEQDGRHYYAGLSNLFYESRFQQIDWTIILSKSRSDVMSALKSFKRTYPLIIFLFLVLIAYFSMLFIRRSLDPLERLKRGTKRIGKQDFSALVKINSGDEFEELGNSFNDMAFKLDKQFSTLQVLAEIDRAILSSLDRKKIIADTLLRLKEFFQCDVSLLLRNSSVDRDHVSLHIMEGRRQSDPRQNVVHMDAEAQDPLFSNRAYCVFDTDEKGYETVEVLAGRADLSFLGLPLSVNGSIDRVLLLGRKREYPFSDDEISQARQISNQLAIALANSLSVEKLNNLAKGTVEALARTVDAKSKWTSGHSERVSALGGRIARAMGLSEEKVETVIRGGLLHDIGKIAIPLAILDKPEKLTDAEYGDIKNHPAIGAQILEPIKAYQDILPLVLQHHERYDGSGYPSGLKGEEIDIRARIMALADVWDALVSDRPYRHGWVAERARKLIINETGTHFDPQVATTFLALLSEEMGLEEPTSERKTSSTGAI